MDIGNLEFPNKKAKRACLYALKMFSRPSAILIPKSTQETMQLYRERRLSMQYSDYVHTYFATEHGWKYFIDFIDQISTLEPFASRATREEILSEFKAAMTRSIKRGQFPETIEELISEIDESFAISIKSHRERSFFKVLGVNIDINFPFAIGSCFLGRFNHLSIDHTFHSDPEFATATQKALDSVFEEHTPVLISGISFGTSDICRVRNFESSEIALSLLQVFINFSYERAFKNLGKIMLFQRPEQGLSRQLDFSLVGTSSSLSDISINTKFASQDFKIDLSLVKMWNTDMALWAINEVIFTNPESELFYRFINSLHFFRQAAFQSSCELQLSTLWIAVESIFTADSKKVKNANISALSALTGRTIRQDHWPSGARTKEELEATLAKNYDYRSRTFHHGRRGIVTETNVNEFSILVCNLILSVAWAIHQGCSTLDDFICEPTFQVQQ